MSAANIAIALCIDWAVTHHDGRIGRVLNAAPLVFIGWLSYSLYLWQQPFLDRTSQSTFAAFPLNIVCAVTLALLSYYVVERPALRLRRTLERATFAANAPSFAEPKPPPVPRTPVVSSETRICEAAARVHHAGGSSATRRSARRCKMAGSSLSATSGASWRCT